jgi:hypothetical protein
MNGIPTIRASLTLLPEIEPGETAEVTMALMYYYEPNVSYEDVVPGATFTLREGPSIVGYGTVLSRDPQAAAGDAGNSRG